MLPPNVMSQPPANTTDPAHPAGPTGAFIDLEDGARLYTEWRRPRSQGSPRGPGSPGSPEGKDAPALVFLHDGLGSIETMRGFPDALADATGLGAFAYDRWGYGRSTERAEFPTLFMEDSAHRLDRLLAAVGIDDCILVGHSDGGTIALLYAAWYPARVRATITMAAHIRRDRLTLGQVKRHHAMVAAGEIPSWMTRFHGDRAARLLAAWTAAWQRPAYDSWDISGEIAPIACPLLAIQGAEDAYGLADQIAGIQAAVPHAETLLIPELGHFPHVEAPARMVAVARDFIVKHVC